MNVSRFALNGVALAAACLWGTQAAALGLGRLSVQSALGETLRAEIEVTSVTPDEASSLKLRVAPPEAYRAAGVDYNAALGSAQVQVVRRADGRSVLRVTSDRAVLEPFVNVIIEATWSSGRLVREYTMLFDPPGARAAQAPVAATAPEATPAPTPAAAPPAPAMAAPAAPLAPAVATAQTPAPAARPPREPRPAPAAVPRAPVAPAAAAAPLPGGDEYRVRAGDSLSRIANRAPRQGISLDQMLVALFRGNPQAFVGDNMNRLKAGVVLSVPSPEQAGKFSPQEAREVIVAQSADFAAYRQRLASGTTATAEAAPARQARGQVQAQVDDRKQAAAATPDRLTLSQGGVKASAPEARASKEAEKKDSAARLAELARNVDELKKLQGATAPAAAPAAPAQPAAPAPMPAPAPAPTPAVAPPALPAPTVVAAAPMPQPAPVASAPSPAPAPAPASAARPAAAKPVPPVAASEEPGLLDSLLDNALLLPGAGVLVALLAGLGLYRLRGRMRKQGGETSFLESRLQPDSFFGASGGQRIDTRDAASSTSGNSSSMSYSLSQLDAIGDVDPVAEADVYLAYGRDLQAEEILKEAMRATPERMAIRSKLLEVYAKRRDTKAYELLASQMFNLTRGEGEDWTQAQALGLTIDPDNVLYQPGGKPEEVRGAGGKIVAEPLGASTTPYTAAVAPPAFQPAPDATLDRTIDVDLEFDLPGGKTDAALPPLTPGEVTQPFSTGAQFGAHQTLDLMLEPGESKTIPVKRSGPVGADDGALDFDLEALGIEPPTVAAKSAPAAASDSLLDFGDFSIDTEAAPAPAPAAAPEAHDPLARKIELAEEFRQIGDLEGARDLLEEVVGKAEGALKSKAQGMLDKLL
ncbi:MAG: FimV/HubP family polar landmark protein [Rubrivivax sp.]|nr:FimV/HubP family polar landmark protein [Rubrivivax sp.]